MAWPIVAYQGVDYYQAQGLFLVPVDPTTGVAIIMLRKDGGIGTGFVGIEQGAPGVHSEIDEIINFTALAFGDPTPDSASWTEIQPASDTNPQIVRLSLALHLGEPGTDGASVLNPASFGTPVAKRMIVVKSDLSGFEYQPQKIADRRIPITMTGYSGGGNSTLTTFSVSTNAIPYDWRPELSGYAIVTGTDAQVDLVARLNNETTGNIIAHCPGIAAPERLQFSDVLATGSNDAFDKVAAGVAATVYVRVEKQGGAGNYTVADGDCRFKMKVAGTA